MARNRRKGGTVKRALRARRRRRRGRGDSGQLMLMLFSEAFPIALTCWICDETLESSAELASHVVASHAGFCSRCKVRHSGDCLPPELRWEPYMEAARFALS